MSESVGSVYVDVLPDARRFSPELKAKLRDVTVDVGLNIDDQAFRAKLDEVTRERTATIRVNADAGRANAEIDAAARTRTANVKVKADKSSLAELRSMLNPAKMGLLSSSVIGLGPALVPIAAGLGGVATALGAPIAAAGGGLTVGALIAGAAVKQTSEQVKQIGQLQKKVESAQQSLANAKAAASTSAANSLASAQRSRDNSITSARASLASATTPAGRTAAERRIASAEAAFSARQASVSASQNARIASAQRQVTQATQAYHAALKSLSPEQRKYMDAQGRLKTSFGNLIRTAGPEILGPVVKGMDALSNVMPHIKPLLDGVSHGIEVLLTDATKFASSSGFSSFIKSFGSLADTSIVSFGRDLENLAVGSGRLLKAFAPLSDSVMKGLEGMTAKFAVWAGHVGDSSTFHHFLTYVQQEGPKVGQFIGDMAVAAAHIARAMAPWGSVVLAGLDGFANFIAHADPGTIEAVGIAIGGLALAFGKGPLGLATAVGAVMVHSPGFLSFLKRAGTLAGDFADAFNKLPAGVKVAAAATLGVGAVAAKLKGAGVLGGKGGGLLGGLIGGVAKGPLRQVTKAGIVPVYVTNKGFGESLGSAGGKKGILATLAALGLRASPVLAPLITSGDSAPPQLGISKPAWAKHQRQVDAWAYLGKKIGQDSSRGADPVLAGLIKNDPSRGLGILKTAADKAGVSWKNFYTKDMPQTTASVQKLLDKYGNLRNAIDKTTTGAHELATVITGFPKTTITKFEAQQLAHNAALVKKYGSMLDGLPKSVKTRIITERINHVQGQLDRFNNGKIPVGATGGIVTRPTVALIGEAGPEAVIPLNRTPGSSPLPKGAGGVHFHGGVTVYADTYEQMLHKIQQRARAKNGGGVNF